MVFCCGFHSMDLVKEKKVATPCNTIHFQEVSKGVTKIWQDISWDHLPLHREMPCAPPGTSKLITYVTGHSADFSGVSALLIEFLLLFACELGRPAVLTMELGEKDPYERAFPTLSKSKVGDCVEGYFLFILSKM